MVWVGFRVADPVGSVPSRILLNSLNNVPRAVDPHSFFADPDSAVFPNANPDPGPD